ncbi:unnamed protein product [Nesidiocoris tenuis]|uniref:Uncharacterized protein n=1 Tax=Nesidiocoris tenuis TaxID=355587 RepID=A0A6H5H637_9HEMI|nr:unnamed protein product [Nesidiocoris tenuis]
MNSMYSMNKMYSMNNMCSLCSIYSMNSPCSMNSMYCMYSMNSMYSVRTRCRKQLRSAAHSHLSFGQSIVNLYGRQSGHHQYDRLETPSGAMLQNRI